MQAQITSNDNDIADIYAKYNALKDSYEAYVIANDAAIQALRSEFEQYVTDNDNRVNNFKSDYNTYIAGNNQRIENLENRFNTYVTNNDQRVLAVENRVTNVENNLTAYIASNNTALTTLQNSFNDFVANKYNIYVANNDVNIANLTNKINTANTNISNLNTNVTNLTNMVNTINSAITNINTDLTGYLKKTVADDTYATKGELNALLERVAALEAGAVSTQGKTLISTAIPTILKGKWTVDVGITPGSQSNPSGSTAVSAHLNCGGQTTLPTISSTEEYIFCIDTATAYMSNISNSYGNLDKVTLVHCTGYSSSAPSTANNPSNPSEQIGYSTSRKTFTTNTSGTVVGTKVWLKSGDYIGLSDGYSLVLYVNGSSLSCKLKSASGTEYVVYTGSTTYQHTSASFNNPESSSTSSSPLAFNDLAIDAIKVYAQSKS